MPSRCMTSTSDICTHDPRLTRMGTGDIRPTHISSCKPANPSASGKPWCLRPERRTFSYTQNKGLVEVEAHRSWYGSRRAKTVNWFDSPMAPSTLDPDLSSLSQTTFVSNIGCGMNSRRLILACVRQPCPSTEPGWEPSLTHFAPATRVALCSAARVPLAGPRPTSIRTSWLI